MFTLGHIWASLFLVHSFCGTLVGAVLFFCADLAGLDRLRGNAVHFVVTGHFVDSHAIGAVEPQGISVAFPAAIGQTE